MSPIQKAQFERVLADLLNRPRDSFSPSALEKLDQLRALIDERGLLIDQPNNTSDGHTIH